jgi:hypothetical protein
MGGAVRVQAECPGEVDDADEQRHDRRPVAAAREQIGDETHETSVTGSIPSG